MYFYDKLTGGSECHADGVDDGSGSPGDGEEAARQSEDDKALWDFRELAFLYFAYIVFASQSEDDEALWIFENKFFCILHLLYLHAKARTTKPFRI